jgi:hypothetical protein
MKVAISFSGLPRLSAQIAIDNWLKIIDQYHADVFIHTWVDQNNGLDDKLIPIFKPKILKYEPSRLLDVREFTQRIWPTADAYRMLSGFTSIYESMNLVEKYSQHQNFIYNIVIRARFDVNVENLILEPIVDGIVIPDDPDKHVLKFTYNEKNVWGINDLFAYGPMSLMRAYATTNLHMHQLYREGVDVCPEIFLTANLMKQQIPIIFKPISQYIVRR